MKSKKAADIKIVDKLVSMPIGDLKPYDKNPHTHPPEQLADIEKSILYYGFNVPILINKEKGIIAGHGRYVAAQKLKMKFVPVIFLEHLAAPAAKAFLLAENKAAEGATWDQNLLAEVMQDLHKVNFDLSKTGFNTEELNELLEDLTVDEPTDGPPSRGRAGGTIREPRAGVVIGIGDYVVVIKNETSIHRIKEFNEFMISNPTLKTETDETLENRALDILDDILPA